MMTFGKRKGQKGVITAIWERQDQMLYEVEYVELTAAEVAAMAKTAKKGPVADRGRPPKPKDQLCRCYFVDSELQLDTAGEAGGSSVARAVSIVAALFLCAFQLCGCGDESVWTNGQTSIFTTKAQVVAKQAIPAGLEHDTWFYGYGGRASRSPGNQPAFYAVQFLTERGKRFTLYGPEIYEQCPLGVMVEVEYYILLDGHGGYKGVSISGVNLYGVDKSRHPLRQYGGANG